jgi:hypothetical protein
MTRATPYARAVVATSLVFGALLVVTVLMTIFVSRSYGERQLGSQAQEAATGLAKALEAGIEDRVMTDTLTTVVFDRGYFGSISVVASNGRMLAYKELPPAVHGVPAWFLHAVALEPPASEALVTRQWRQLGRVIVKSHPAFAYLQLWHTVLALCAVLAAAYAAMLFVLRRVVPRSVGAGALTSASGRTPAAAAFSLVPRLKPARSSGRNDYPASR